MSVGAEVEGDSSRFSARRSGMTYNRRPMVLERLYLFLFVIYCTTVGTVLVALPWSPAWEQLLLHLPLEALDLLRSHWFRGALTGFGMVHLVWSVHDLNRVLAPDLLMSEHGEAPGSRPSDSAP